MESDADADDNRDDLSCRGGRAPLVSLGTVRESVCEIEENVNSTYDKKNEQYHIAAPSDEGNYCLRRRTVVVRTSRSQKAEKDSERL